MIRKHKPLVPGYLCAGAVGFAFTSMVCALFDLRGTQTILILTAAALYALARLWKVRKW